MSAWLLAAREVYETGGSKPVKQMWSPPAALEKARACGLILRGEGRGSAGKNRPTPPAALTPMGVDVCEHRLEQYVPFMGHGPTGGRAKGSHRRWRATWLAALPRANEVRLTGPVHRAQDDGTCYW